MPDAALRFRMLETRSAAAIAHAVCPDELSDVLSVLSRFELTGTLLLSPGGNRGCIPRILDGAFHKRGWMESRVDIA